MRKVSQGIYIIISKFGLPVVVVDNIHFIFRLIFFLSCFVVSEPELPEESLLNGDGELNLEGEEKVDGVDTNNNEGHLDDENAEEVLTIKKTVCFTF